MIAKEDIIASFLELYNSEKLKIEEMKNNPHRNSWSVIAISMDASRLHGMKTLLNHIGIQDKELGLRNEEISDLIRL